MTSAVISPCGKYRYMLERQLNPENPILDKNGIVFVMLNPSTADEKNDDPTIRKCMGFASRWGYSKMLVVNLYGYRATNPKELENTDDPIGPDNYLHIAKIMTCQKSFVCAWGNNADKTLTDRFIYMAGLYDVPLFCLGLTKKCQPKHPLYVPYSQELITFF